VFNSYKAVLESVQMSAKTAFFAENYARLKYDYKGNIPESEIVKLSQQTRNLSGDMSRQSNSKFVQGTTSVFPYSNAILQGTRHVLSTATPSWVRKGVNDVGGNMLENNNSIFWTRFMSAVFLPKLGALAVLSQWEGAEEYYYDLPHWKQMGMIPFPTPEALSIWASTGNLPKFDPKYIVEMRLVPPEFGMIVEPAISGLRVMGVLNKSPNSKFQSEGDLFGETLSQITGFVTPPLVSALLAADDKQADLHRMLKGQGLTREVYNESHGGANADKMTHNSSIDKTFYNVVGALLGSSGKIAMQTLNVADIEYRESEDFGKALDAALDTAGFEIKSRMPDIAVKGLYEPEKRRYVSTPAYDYVREQQRDLEPIIGSGRQISVETDSKGRNERHEALDLETANKITDPFLKALATNVRDIIKKKGPFKDAQDAYTEIRADLAALEASRYKVSDTAYNKMRNDYVEKQQGLIRIQATELKRVNDLVVKSYGRRYTQKYGEQFSFESLSNQVRKNVKR